MTDNLFLEILDSLHEGKTVMLGEAACAMVGEYITNLENDIADLELLQGDCNVKDACIAALEADNARLQQDCLDADRLMTDAMSARDQALAEVARLRAENERLAKERAAAVAGIIELTRIIEQGDDDGE